MSLTKFKMDNFFILFIIIGLLKLFVCEDDEYFKSIQYCKMACLPFTGNKTLEHAACKCDLLPGREIITEDLDNFRTKVVDLLNELRNKVASGKENRMPTAMNSEVMSYDLELEYISTCLAKKYEKPDQHSCVMPTNSGASLNMARGVKNFTQNGTSVDTSLHLIKHHWYDEQITLVLNSTSGGEVNIIGLDPMVAGHLFLLWFDANRVGCARVFYEGAEKHFHRCALICSFSSNHWGWMSDGPPYHPGPPCLHCRFGLKCNQKYTALCGEVIPPRMPEPFTPPPTTSDVIDVLKIDYCKLPCMEGRFGNESLENTMCGCGIGNDDRIDYWAKVSEEPDNIIKFRQMVLDTHNSLRNQIASGYEYDPDLPPAADMLAFSYDLELEHGARCHIKRHVKAHDKCRRTSRFQRAGQNIASGNNQRSNVRDRISAWYMEELHNAIPSMIGNFSVPQGVRVTDMAHFTQMVWGADKYVGCATGFRPKNTEFAWRWIIICNYGGSPGANQAYAKMYTAGKPCSQCPNGTKCNDKYPNLCGEIEPIPAPPQDQQNTPPPGFDQMADGEGTTHDSAGTTLESFSQKIAPSYLLNALVTLNFISAWMLT